MRRGIDIRPKARRDLLDIADYTDARWGVAQSQIYLNAIAEALDQIAGHPDLGSDRSEVSPGLRKWRSGEHNIFYRVTDDAVVISRILHRRMDIDGMSWEGEPT